MVFVFFRFNQIGNLIESILSICTPVFYGIIMAYIMNPIMVFIERIYALVAKKVFRVKTDRYKKSGVVVAIALSVTIMLLMLWTLMFSVLPQIYDTILSFVKLIPGEFDKVQEWFSDFVDPQKQWTVWLDSLIRGLLDKIENWFKADLTQTITLAMQYLTSGVSIVLSFVVDFILGLCISIYLLKDKNKIFSHIHKIVHAVFKPSRAKTVTELGMHAKAIFNGYVYGTLLGCMIVFVTTFTFMAISGMPYVLLISTLVCVTNVIPFFGPFIGAIPSVFILLMYDPHTALIFAIFTLILQQVEGHFLTPLLISKTTEVSPFWVTVALLMGGGFFGAPGLLFAVPVFSVIYYIIKVLVERRLYLKKLPVDSEYYENKSDFDYMQIKYDFQKIKENISEKKNNRSKKKRKK